jgi:hypothetical protein
MPSDNVTLGLDTIEIVDTGTYLVGFTIVAQAAVAFDLEVAVQINGTTLPELSVSTILIADFQTISLSAITDLTASDTLTLTVSSTAGGTITFGPGMNANLHVVRLA